MSLGSETARPTAPPAAGRSVVRAASSPKVRAVRGRFKPLVKFVRGQPTVAGGHPKDLDDPSGPGADALNWPAHRLARRWRSPRVRLVRPLPPPHLRARPVDIPPIMHILYGRDCPTGSQLTARAVANRGVSAPSGGRQLTSL